MSNPIPDIGPAPDRPPVRRSRRHRLAGMMVPLLAALAPALIALGASEPAMAMGGRGVGGFHGVFARPSMHRLTMRTGQYRPGRWHRRAGRDGGSDRPTAGHERRPHWPSRTLVTIPALLTPAPTATAAQPLAGATPGGSPRLAPGPGFASALNIPAAGETRYVPDEVLIGFAATVNPQAVVGIAQGQRLALLGIHRLALVDAIVYRFRITDGRSVPAVIASFSSDSRISRAQPNYLYAAQGDATKADATDATRDAAPAGGDPAQYVLGKLDVAHAHAIARGNRVLVAVIDSSIDATHPDLAGAIAGRFDAVKSTDAPHRHGTAIAGAIAAHGRLLGIAPAARILAARAFDATAAGAASTTARLLDSLQWASDSGARIINMSFAGPADPRLHEMVAAARRKGVTLIAAAGNDGPTAPPAYPAAYAEVIAVTATDADDHAFRQSNHGAYLAVAAPGVDIMVAAPDAGYGFTTGTSIAAAHVSGLAALMLERYPDLTPDALEAILLRTAKDLGPPGRDTEFGAGLVDAYGALTALAAQTADRAPAN